MPTHDHPFIGVVGGMGPAAGLDLCRKLFDQTRADVDQDHLDVVMLSTPRLLPDRTEFLCGHSPEDPTPGILASLRSLDTLGATVAGMPCNTAHAPRILDPVLQRLDNEGSSIRLVHMIDEVAKHLTTLGTRHRRVGVLATTGTVICRVYDDARDSLGFELIYPDDQVQHEQVHRSVYDPGFGIKANTRGATAQSREMIEQSAEHLIEKGAEVIVLACTELPLAFERTTLRDRPVIDATRILARALIRAVAPDRLVPADLGGGVSRDYRRCHLLQLWPYPGQARPDTWFWSHHSSKRSMGREAKIGHDEKRAFGSRAPPLWQAPA